MNTFRLFLILLAVSTATHASPPKGEPTNASEAAKEKAEEEAAIDAKYQSLVSTLSPKEQAWEKVLQENLGNFYLPIHKKQKINGQSNAWDFVRDDPSLPRILLIGDSVSRGYTKAVREELSGIANVHRAPANCGPTKTGIEKLDIWLGDGEWDIIHFNFGIHDRNTPLSEYSNRLETLVEKMEETGAKLIWASTTPIPDVEEKKFVAESIVERNEAAADIMKKHEVATDDLYSAMLPHLAEYQNKDDVHFNNDGYTFLGNTVAESIVENLK